MKMRYGNRASKCFCLSDRRRVLLVVVFLTLNCGSTRIGQLGRSSSDATGTVSQRSNYLLTRQQVEKNLLDAYYEHNNTDKILYWLRYLAAAQYARPLDLLRVGSYYAEHGNLDDAEIWYRKALVLSNGAIGVRLELLRLLIHRRCDKEVRFELSQLLESADFLTTAQAAWFSKNLSMSHRSDNDQKIAALATATAIFQSPEQREFWSMWDGFKDEGNTLNGKEWAHAPPNFPAFRSVLQEGSPYSWPLDIIENKISKYEKYIETLSIDGHGREATFFRERTASVVRMLAFTAIRRGYRERSLELHLLAERIAPLTAHPLSMQVTAMRDMADIYSHLGRFRHSLAVLERLLRLCNGKNWTEEDACPEVGVVPDLIERRASSGERRNYDFLEHVLNEARAYVSFESTTGHLRYRDGHDFPIEKEISFERLKNVLAKNPDSVKQLETLKEEDFTVPIEVNSSKMPYSSTSPEEDRVEFLMKITMRFGSDKDIHSFADQIAAEIRNGRFELPVKALLSRLAFLGCAGTAQPQLDEGLKRSGLGFTIEQLALAMTLAPTDSIPQPTREAYDVIQRTLQLCARVVSRDVATKLLPKQRSSASRSRNP